MNELVLERYRSSAKRHGVATANGDHEAANGAYNDLMAALAEMRHLPDRGRSWLSALLCDNDPFVVCSAATHLLPIEEALARQALEKISDQESGIVGFNAKMVLREWDAGRLTVE